MKAILVIDMPETCSKCELHGKDMEGIYCEVCSEKDYIKEYKGIPSWCPLKPMPEKKWVAKGFDRIMENNKEHLMSLGWNDCLEELLNTGLNYSKEGEEIEK